MIETTSVFDALRVGTWNDEERAYAEEHYPRFTFLLNLLGEEFARFGASPTSPVRFLDVGPHMTTRLVDDFFGDSVHIDTLGWEQPRLYDTSRVHTHIQFDLNDAHDPAHWPAPVEHDVVLMAEVIEHLYTAPVQVLACLRTFVRPGGVLVIGTPNGVALAHRLRLLVGRQPYEQIRLDRTNPGHFREYTARELAQDAGTVGFRVRETTFHDFAPSRYALARTVTRAAPSLRQMMTIILERES